MSDSTASKQLIGISRRHLLQGTAGLAGILASGLSPAIAQEKITLRYLGTAVNQDKKIAEKFEADTGIKIQYVAVTTDDVTKRAVTAPNSFDLIDTEYFSLKKIVPTGNLKGIDTKKIKNADKITTLFTTGTVGGKAVGDQGTAPKKVIFLEGEKSKVFAKSPTQFMSLIPTVYNADTLGIRPDLIKRPISSWAELLNPEFKGKAAILNIPSIGIMDAAMVVRSHGHPQVRRQGQHDQGRDRPDDQDPDRGQEGRPVPRAVEGLQRIRQPDGLGRSGDPVDVEPCGHRRAQPKALTVCSSRSKKLSRLGGRLWSAHHPQRPQTRRRLRVHQLVPRRMGRCLPQPPGLLQRGAGNRQGQDGALRMGLLDGRQTRRPGHQEPQR
ncbi:MAG: extracellular solute-binding protein [Burkholderiaceae bacterium]